MLQPKDAHDLRVVTDGGGVDHAEPEPTLATVTQAAGPVGEIAREPEDVAGVADDRCGTVADASTTAVTLEQRHPDTPFEFAQSLRECRCAHADTLGRHRP